MARVYSKKSTLTPNSMKPVRTRFAPSPTGDLHIGGARTALFNYLYAKKHGGTFVLRVEDTDRSRYVEGSVEGIVEGLKWLGISADEGFPHGGPFEPYLQSKRLEQYEKAADLLVAEGKAYYCFCSPEQLDRRRKEQMKAGKPPKYDRHCLALSQEEVQQKLDAEDPKVTRFLIPEGETVFRDAVYGEIKIDHSAVDDQVLVKSDGFPTYHLANIVDDHHMEISHVIRGEEWISSVPKHILLYKAFGWEPPVFAHLPVFLSKTGGKMSKRQGDVALLKFREKGYLPEAVVNFIALLGWNPKSEREFFSLEDLVEAFDLGQVNRASPIFETEKLDWMNGEYIRKMTPAELVTATEPFREIELPKGKEEEAVEMFQERMKRLDDLNEFAGFLKKADEYDPTLLIWKKMTLETAQESLGNSLAFIGTIGEDEFEKGALEDRLKEWIQENEYDNGPVLWPLRVALSGRKASPSPFEIMAVIGKKASIDRIQLALNSLDTLR